jgi:hypothetical protein
MTMRRFFGYLFAMVSDECPIPPPTSTMILAGGKEAQSNPENPQLFRYKVKVGHGPWNMVSGGSDAAVPCIPSPNLLSR